MGDEGRGWDPYGWQNKVFHRCILVLELLALIFSVIALPCAGLAVVIALRKPLWQTQVNRRLKIMEEEWEEVLDKIKRRGDRLSKERGLLRRAEKTDEPEEVTVIDRKQAAWARYRARKGQNA